MPGNWDGDVISHDISLVLPPVAAALNFGGLRDSLVA
jgi:hypothetical protein